MAQLFKYCPRCGRASFDFKQENLLVCDCCGFELYRNAASAVAALILTNDRKLLLTVRSKEPAKGKFGLPGGFVDYRENAETALMREIREEVFIHIEKFEYLCSHPNTYLFKEVTYYTLDLFFIARIPQIPEMKFDLDEVDRIEWMAVEKVDLSLMAFQSMRYAIQQLRQK